MLKVFYLTKINFCKNYVKKSSLDRPRELNYILIVRITTGNGQLTSSITLRLIKFLTSNCNAKSLISN